MPRAFWSLLVLLLALPAPAARAHPLSPASVVIEEAEAQGRYAVSFRRSEQAAPTLVLDLPKACVRSDLRTSRDADQLVDRFTLACPGSLEGKSVRVLGLVELELGALVYARFRDGRSARALLTPAQQSFTLPARSPALHVLRDYVGLGIEHLLTGFDHLLFLAGLLCMVKGARRLVVTLTAFTLGHSVTLCLAALSLLSVPQEPVELGIAISLVVLALALLDEQAGWSRPGWMAFGFGLLHGLGFAGALAATGLPAEAIPLALFGFNLGVELGQLAVVFGFALLLAAWRYLPAATRTFSPQRMRVLAGYSIGSLAAMWCLERALDWLA
jgi:hypothetical protein